MPLLNKTIRLFSSITILISSSIGSETFTGTVTRHNTAFEFVYKTVQARSAIECVRLCKLDDACKHVAFTRKRYLCGFISNDAIPLTSLDPLNETTSTENMFIEINTPSDCEDIGSSSQGIYKILPKGAAKSFNVLCDNGWTVIQKRFDGSVDFDKPWEDYKIGFGNLNGEFWLGLENTYLLTNQANYTIQIEVDLIDGGHIVKDTYTNFRVEDEANWYKLLVSDDAPDTNDQLGQVNGMYFTTRDQDRDTYSSNCAILKRAGWWYKGCARLNLNSPMATSASICLGGTNMAHCMKIWVNTLRKAVVSSVMKIRRE